jgi:hypothetical protein
VIARRIAALVVAALLAGCADSRTTSGLESPIPETMVTAVNANHNSLRATKGSALLYVSDPDAGTVFIYSYPALKPAGRLTRINSPTGMCVDQKTGNVWITETNPYAAGAIEFAHGGRKAIETLQIGSGNFANACAVNPTNGELAVANRTFDGDDPGDVIVFNVHTGKSKTYYDKSLFYVEFLGYDSRGDLFVDSTRGGTMFRFAELPKGARKLVNIRWHGPSISLPGNVQDDGTSITVGSVQEALLYRTLAGKVTGTTTFDGACYTQQYFIDGDKVIVPSDCRSVATVSVYNYPAGGKPIMTLSGFKSTFGAVISP